MKLHRLNKIAPPARNAARDHSAAAFCAIGALAKSLLCFALTFFFLSAFALGIGASPAQASELKPLRIVIGYPPGGVLDIFARSLAEEIGKREGRPVVVVNKPGASSLLAINDVAREKPDGNTMLITHSMPFTIYPFTYDNLQSAQDDFASVAYLANIPIVWTAGPEQPFDTVAQYIDWLKKNPNEGAVGLITLGGQPHFALLQMASQLGVDAYPVPYPGTPQLVNDEIGGNIATGILAIGPQIDLYRAGKIKILGVTGKSQVSFLPKVRTLSEQGVPGFDNVDLWYGAYFPRNTPKEIVQKYEKMLIDIVGQDALKQKFEKQALILEGKPAAEMSKLLDQERSGWEPIIKKTGFRAQ